MYAAAIVCTIAIATTGANPWFAAAMLFVTGLLGGYDIRGRVARR